MRRLSKLIPRSTGGRWAAGLSLAGLVGVGIYLVFFVFAFHLIFVDEVVDEEAPEFATDADIDQLISEALDVAATAGGTETVGSDNEVTEQPMSVGEHEVDASSGADEPGSSGATEGSSTGLADESPDGGVESGEADSSAADGSDATSSGGGSRDEASGSQASGAADGSDGGAADDSGGGTAGQSDSRDRSDSQDRGDSSAGGSTTGDEDAAGASGSGQADDGDAGSDGSDQGDGNTGSDSGGHQGDSSTGSDSGGHQGDGDSGDSGGDQGDGGVRVSHVGSFGPRSHPAEGAVVVLTDGTQTVLRFDDSFATDNGPDLNVYLHTAGPDASVDDLVADFIDLGDLKGNIGAQNYLIRDVDLSRYRTVSVWCVRFRVVFGTAELMPMS